MLEILSFLQSEEKITSDVAQATFLSQETIYSFPNHNYKIGIIKSGFCQLEGYLNEQWVLLGILKSEDIFGVEILLDDPSSLYAPIQYRITTLQRSEIFFLEREYILNHLYGTGGFQKLLRDCMIQSMIKYANHYLKAFSPPSERIHNALYEIAKNLDLPIIGNKITFPKFVTKTFITRYTRCNRSRVYKTLNELQTKNIILAYHPLQMVPCKEQLLSKTTVSIEK
ncbi:Crp/Fnr family transcriptional regulator [Listeria kieliensis]|uniref:Crp/Fnr family transcriptional regulator n=1 Tax=Listeria kieliensis TaxID=1621700 RepID=A0A3D8TM40_9LIST|nr:Crp/Fnr family transcriptional regulator [Listeria kieliensis]RDW99592.1 hypothetical protein UR08_12335 [Listeria kieliensis]